MKPWFTITVPVISIKHLKASTIKWLRAEEALGALDFMCAPHDNGFFMVRAGPDSRLELPNDLRAVMDAADDNVTHGWFAVDVDGDVVDGLATYKD